MIVEKYGVDKDRTTKTNMVMIKIIENKYFGIKDRRQKNMALIKSQKIKKCGAYEDCKKNQISSS